MKRIIPTIFLLLITTCATAQCYEGHRTEGINAYNNGNYQLAKQHFDYILKKCDDKPASNDIQGWINKCNDALTPRLSVSSQNLSFSAYGESKTITVSSNRDWYLANTSSNMFTVSASGENVTVRCYQNSGAYRTDYFDIKTIDGTKSARIYVSQSAYSNSNSINNNSSSSPYLTLSKTSISAPAAGTTEYITVSTNREWEIQYPSGTMYSVTKYGCNQVKVVISQNTSNSARADYFNVKLKDGSKSIKVSLSQANLTPKGYAMISSAYIEHNVFENDIKGMRIHIHFCTYGGQYHEVGPVVSFYKADGTHLKDTNGKYYYASNLVASWKYDIASYSSTEWKDFTLFMPYSELHMPTGCKNVSLYADIAIYDADVKAYISNSKQVSFSFSN